MSLKRAQPDWTSRCGPLRDGGADGEQNQTENGKKKEKKKLCWFLKFIWSVVIKDNAQEHKLWKKKSLHDGDSEFDIALSFLNIGIFFLIYFKTAMLKVKKQTNRWTEETAEMPKKDIILGGVLLLVSLGTAPVSVVCACTMSSPYST